MSINETKNKKESRQYFSDENAMLCDAIRKKIEIWKEQNLISDDEYYFLITSLVESIDKYANTASVYGAFLKKLKKTAQNNLILKPAELIINEQDHQVFNEDINKVAGKIAGDILYLDPPYNQRQYATNYHMLETIAKYIFLSYNNEGLMTLGDIKEIMSLRGKYGHFTKEYNRFKADKSENRNYIASKTTEYLHYVIFY